MGLKYKYNPFTGNFDISGEGTNNRIEIEALYKVAYAVAYSELTYNIDSNIISVDIWDSADKGTKLFTKTITYTDGTVTNVSITDEVTSATLSTAIHYNGSGKIDYKTKTFTS